MIYKVQCGRSGNAEMPTRVEGRVQNLDHTQRAGGETVTTEYNPPTSPRYLNKDENVIQIKRCAELTRIKL